MRLSKSDIEKLSSSPNTMSITRSQARLMGIDYPLKEGWMNRVLMKDYSPEIYKQIMLSKRHESKVIPSSFW